MIVCGFAGILGSRGFCRVTHSAVSFLGSACSQSALASAALAGIFFALPWNRVPGLAERLALGVFMVCELGVALELIRSRPRGESASVAASRTQRAFDIK